MLVKFLADECCDAGLVFSLRAEGHDVRYVMEVGAGSIDESVLQAAHFEERVLLTEDKDFGELVYRLQKQAFSVVLLRFSVSNRNLKWPRLHYLIEHFGHRLPGHFVIVNEERYRFRPLRAF